MVTLTRVIDMYLSRPFPRPQFSKGHGPSYWPFRGPSSRRGVLSPPRTGPRTPAERCAEPTRRAAHDDFRESTATTRAPPSTPGSTRRRAAQQGEAERPTGRPAAQRPEPRRRPGRSHTTRRGPPRRPRATRTGASHPHDAPSGATLKSATRTQTRGHFRRGPDPARRPPDDHPAELPKDDGRQENSPRTQSENRARDQDRDHAGGDDEELERRAPTIPPAPQAGPNGIQRPHFNDAGSTTGRRAERARRTASKADIQQDIHPAQRRSESSRSPPHDRECGAPEGPRSSTIGTRRPNAKPPSRSRPERDEIHP